MYDELLAELTAMNGNAKALLEKYDNAGVKLDAKTQELLTAIADAGTNGLNAIQKLLDSGNVAQAENALRLGGKTLTEIEKSVGQILQVVTFNDLDFGSVSCPHYDNNKANFRQPVSTVCSLVTKKANSKILIFLTASLMADGSHMYLDMKCNGNWVGGEDGMMSSHHSYSGLQLPYSCNGEVDTKSPAETQHDFTFWVGDWGGSTVYFNDYSEISNSNSKISGHLVLMEVAG